MCLTGSVTRRSSPAGSASASGWPGRWRRIHRSCSWTSRSGREARAPGGGAGARARGPPAFPMAEPFGAIDPITRERLQNEFLRLQAEIKKTIVFVTHDIDEAIKMGDRIAILQTRSRIAQYDTPERILTDPANEFVEDFIGAGASIKRLSLSQVRDIKTADWPVAMLSEGREAARELMRSSEKDYVLLLDDRRRPRRWVSGDALAVGGDPDEAGWPAVAIVE